MRNTSLVFSKGEQKVAKYRLQVRPDGSLRVTGTITAPSGSEVRAHKDVKTQEELAEAAKAVAEFLSIYRQKPDLE